MIFRTQLSVVSLGQADLQLPLLSPEAVNGQQVYLKSSSNPMPRDHDANGKKLDPCKL
jgi:hypothetical protein